MRALYLYLMIAAFCCVSFENVQANQEESAPKAKKVKMPKKPITMDVTPWWEEDDGKEEAVDTQIPEEEFAYTGEESQAFMPAKRRDLDKSNYVPMPKMPPQERDLDKSNYVPMPKMPPQKRDLGKTQYAPILKKSTPDFDQERDETVDPSSSTASSMDKGYTVKERKKFFEEWSKNN